MEQTVAASKQTRADPSPIKGSFLNSVPSMIMTFGVTVSSKGNLTFFHYMGVWGIYSFKKKLYTFIFNQQITNFVIDTIKHDALLCLLTDVCK